MNFCSKIIPKDNKGFYPLFDEFSYRLYDNVGSINSQEWEKVNQSRNIFLGVDYLKILENTNNEHYQYFYVTIFNKNEPIGICFFQIVTLSANLFGSILSNPSKKAKEENKDLFTKNPVGAKGYTLFKLLTLGNNFISGEHGFIFSERVRRELQFELIEKMCKLMSLKGKLRGSISATLVKDFYPNSLPLEKNKLLESKFLPFSAEPNMEIEMPKNLESVQDYVALFSKKYRNRTKNIFKALNGVTKKEFTLDDIEQHHEKIYQLYLQVYENAKFKLSKLGPDYFYQCKKIFGENFIVTGYLYHNILIGFSSAFNKRNEEFEAHFIGVDYELNPQFELYQNILYHFIDSAIRSKSKKLILGRTAAEIKSTTGAKGKELICYVKPENALSKIILKQFIHHLQPSEWIPRNPFKSNS